MNKKISQKFDISSTDKKQVRLDAKIYSQDINSAVFQLSFSDNGSDLELDDTYEVSVLSIFRDSNRKILINAPISGNEAIFTFDNRLITNWDVIDSYVYLKKDDKTVDVNSFSFKVDVSKIDSVISDIKVYYIEDLEDLKDEYIKKMESINKDYQDLLDAYIDGLPSAEDLKGKAGTIDIIGVEALEENEDPKVINSGTESSAKLTFQIPRGHQGEQGERGEGLKIDHTVASMYELSHMDKNKLNDGDYIVISSLDDDNGKMYKYNKSQDSFLKIATIATKGNQGEPGESIKGDQGDDGLTAFEVAKKNGFKGTEMEWLTSLKAVWVQVTRSQYEQLKASGKLVPTTLYMVV